MKYTAFTEAVKTLETAMENNIPSEDAMAQKSGTLQGIIIANWDSFPESVQKTIIKRLQEKTKEFGGTHE